jgi:hypothetical protein
MGKYGDILGVAPAPVSAAVTITFAMIFLS